MEPLPVFVVTKIHVPSAQLDFLSEPVFVDGVSKKVYEEALPTVALRAQARRSKATYLVTWSGVRNPRGAKIGDRVVARENIGKTSIVLFDVLGNPIGTCEYRPSRPEWFRMLVFVK